MYCEKLSSRTQKIGNVIHVQTKYRVIRKSVSVQSNVRFGRMNRVQVLIERAEREILVDEEHIERHSAQQEAVELRELRAAIAEGAQNRCLEAEHNTRMI